MSTSSRGKLPAVFAAVICLLGLCAVLFIALRNGPPPQDSGGVLIPEQAAYDISFYDLQVAVHPARRHIDGRLRAHADVSKTLDVFVLDLDHRLSVDTVTVRQGGTVRRTTYESRNNQLWIDLPVTARPGDRLMVDVRYAGEPRVAPNAPWDGGFSWNETAEGLPWIATSCQTVGADVWWPCKDHPSDEPDSMAISVRVPQPLVVASNGVLRRVTQHEDGSRSYHWFSSTPINNYGVALNIAPYDTLRADYVSTSGMEVPVTFWVLPARHQDARRVLPEFLAHLRFLEETLGPYPFRTDKYGIAHVPFLGMEHQSIIAYGSGFGSGGLGYDQGFDALHFHELAHEWWGNVVTARDWKDFWIHEGIGTYMEALYAEHIGGEEALHATVRHMQSRIEAGQQIAWRSPTTAMEAYHLNIYMRGAAMMHSLRFLLGEDAFFQALRTIIYPTEALQNATEGRQTRLVDADEVIRLAEEATGHELGWFFDIYLYQPDLPQLGAEVEAGKLYLTWHTADNQPFPMPVEVQIGEERRRVAMSDGAAVIDLEGQPWEIDPDGWVLRRGVI